MAPYVRVTELRRLIESKPLVRVLEAHNGLSAYIAESVRINKHGDLRQFDAIWLSSLTDSTARGRPDIEYIDFCSRQNTLMDILETSSKPIIFDGETGGPAEHFALSVKTLERLGVSAVVIEDKIGLKKNSLFGRSVEQIQDSPIHFSEKIRVGKSVALSGSFMVFARIESLNTGAGVEDALERAAIYIDAGADGIMIHSSATDTDELFAFCRRFKGLNRKVPLMVVPSTFSQVSEAQLTDEGVRIVIYANQLLRSAYPAMMKVAELILRKERALEAESLCMSIPEMLRMFHNKIK